ncbi:MAG: cell division ATP-binding protein FtsE [Candidatus Niyogibacteria bacterium CG10_big_fil_rev_8_21_14_0_10_42_19]|uniref:Cell division ATP-binding protein FtsE n=1 Tax=Candidatus Niyogibacteria bacterium CG10_big_fil_rev_8_21_14_0_10_42_19 TaxID=1974725 RepID=A0A2H0TGD4_9BACT|nr:MAG: cell division ATP-binding protein FtsE [Candidatus Niyogibacteria bacterium CG10_big_fil_rev_8_21_14_0_10_42_19]
MIYFDHVSKVYSPTSTALDDVSFTIEPKEFISIVGKSGAGKTTLLKLLLAEEKPSSGRVFFESQNVHSLPRTAIHKIRRRIGTIFQDFRLLASKTCYENIAFAMEASGSTDEEIEADVPQVMDLVGLMNKAWHFPHELSGGEKQRAAIARAIVNRPDVIIADEPTGNLDPINTWEIIELLKKINSMGTTVILATHAKDIINSLDKRVITIEDGKIIRDAKRGRYVL